MTADELWAAIDDQRLRTADLLATLSDAEWRRPSLCEGWTVRDVAAHLTLQQLGVGDVIRFTIRHPGTLGGLNRMIREQARVQAVMPPEAMVAEIRGMVGSRRHNVGVTPEETLVDILVHGQDIAVPLGLVLEMSIAATVFASSRVWSYGGRGKAKVFTHVPLGDYRFTATDADWSAGSGPAISGPIAAILLLLTGRPALLDRLSGDGLPALRRRLAAA
ncbi:maleylpyruvate isomerase family mycothiol-dependent enzyme [Bacillus safensis]|uniref:maleylpyruvate isomerase family mycothiol-dependent enzyme n=1 Tax=Bacillus safensis TaxID=561879 RepID=UPI00366153FC